MKRIIITLLATAALAGCSKTDIESPVAPAVPDPSAPITLSAGIQTTTESRAAIDGTAFPANTTNVFRITAYAGSAAPSGNWQTTYFADEQVNSGAASLIALKNNQYYPANGDKVYFYAYTLATTVTAGTSSSAPIANYTITGQEDIMAAQVVTGIAKVGVGATQSQPAFTFAHKLKQVKFKVVKDASFEASKNVTKITVKSIKTSAKMPISTGVLTFDTTTGDISLTPNVEITAGGADIPGSLMFEPGTTFTVSIVADGVTYPDVAVTLTGNKAGEAGVSHTVTLTFKRSGIVPTATITNWVTGTGASNDVM